MRLWPSLNVYPGPVFYNLVDQAAISEIVTRHLGNGAIADQWLFRPKIEGVEATMICAKLAKTAWRRAVVASVTVTHVPGTTYQTRIDTGDLALIGDEPVDRVATVWVQVPTSSCWRPFTAPC